MQKTFRGNDSALAGINLGLSGDTEHATKMVDMRMRVYDCSNGPCA